MKFKHFFTTLFLFFSFSICFAKNSESNAKKIRAEIVAKAKTYIGCPYKLGATGPNSFDCSGLIYTVFKDVANIQLPRSAKAIYSAVKIVSSSDLEEGDLIFFHTGETNTINHVGIYIGRNQFIHAASAGSNLGVIVSSLTEKYYKKTYAAIGKVLPSAKKNELEEEIIFEESTDEEKISQSKNDESKNNSFLSNLTFDASLSCDWSFWLPNKFLINYRGISLTTMARYTKWALKPGIGTILRWNQGTQVFQLPILFSLNFNDYVGIYVGPVISFGNPKVPETNTQIAGSFFPGVIGISLNTPAIKIKKVYLSFCHDFIYTVYNQQDGAALTISDSFNSGFVFSTGVKISLPFKNL